MNRRTFFRTLAAMGVGAFAPTELLEDLVFETNPITSYADLLQITSQQFRGSLTPTCCAETIGGMRRYYFDQSVPVGHPDFFDEHIAELQRIYFDSVRGTDKPPTMWLFPGKDEE